MLRSVALSHRACTALTDNGDPVTRCTCTASRRERTEQIIFAVVLTGLGLLRGIRLVVDSLDDALTLPRSIQ